MIDRTHAIVVTATSGAVRERERGDGRARDLLVDSGGLQRTIDVVAGEVATGDALPADLDAVGDDGGVGRTRWGRRIAIAERDTVHARRAAIAGRVDRRDAVDIG